MDSQDRDLILLLASSSASLAEVPGKNNWIEKADGDLPPYVRKLARGIMKSGKSKSQAIAIAISRIKAWAAGGDDVNADTRAKAAKALAQWEALKSKNAAKKLVKASREDGTSYIMLTNTGAFNTELVRNAWYARNNPLSHSPGAVTSEPSVSGWIKELWTTFLIVEFEFSSENRFQKVPYTVTGSTVEFGQPTPVEQVWTDTDGVKLSANEETLLADVLKQSPNNYLAKVQSLVKSG